MTDLIRLCGAILAIIVVRAYGFDATDEIEWARLTSALAQNDSAAAQLTLRSWMSFKLVIGALGGLLAAGVFVEWQTAGIGAAFTRFSRLIGGILAAAYTVSHLFTDAQTRAWQDFWQRLVFDAPPFGFLFSWTALEVVLALMVGRWVAEALAWPIVNLFAIARGLTRLAWAIRADGLGRRGRYAEMEESLRKSGKRPRDVLIDVANTAKDAGHYAEAIPRYGAALELRYDEYDAWKLIECHESLDQVSDAMRFRLRHKLASFDPGDVYRAYLGYLAKYPSLGLTLGLSHDELRPMFTRVAAVGWFYSEDEIRGPLDQMYALGFLSEAVIVLKKFSDHSWHERASLHDIRLGRTYEQLGQFEDALALYNQYTLLGDANRCHAALRHWDKVVLYELARGHRADAEAVIMAQGDPVPLRELLTLEPSGKRFAHPLTAVNGADREARILVFRCVGDNFQEALEELAERPESQREHLKLLAQYALDSRGATLARLSLRELSWLCDAAGLVDEAGRIDGLISDRESSAASLEGRRLSEHWERPAYLESNQPLLGVLVAEAAGDRELASACYEVAGGYDRAIEAELAELTDLSQSSGNDQRSRSRDGSRRLARLYLKRGDLANAAASLRRTLRLKSGPWVDDDWRDWEVVAALFTWAGHVDDAKETLAEATARARGERAVPQVVSHLRSWRFHGAARRAARARKAALGARPARAVRQIEEIRRRWVDSEARCLVPNGPRLYTSAGQALAKPRFFVEDVADWFESREAGNPLATIFAMAALARVRPDRCERLTDADRFKGRRIESLLRETELRFDLLTWILDNANFTTLKNIVDAQSGTFVIRRMAEPVWSTLHELSGGVVILECEPCHPPQSLFSTATAMRGGTIIVRPWVHLDATELGSDMEDGEIVVEGDFHGRSLGQRMAGGRIHVMGNATHPHVFVGTEMKEGRISIAGTCLGSGSIGTEMTGGEIRMGGDARGESDTASYLPTWYVGGRLSGGQVRVDGSITAAGAVEIGHKASGGRILIRGDVESREGSIAYGLIGNAYIRIGGRSRVTSVGAYMSGGALDLRGDVDSDVGDQMNGGEIDLEGNVKRISPRRTGGLIRQRGVPITTSRWKRFVDGL